MRFFTKKRPNSSPHQGISTLKFQENKAVAVLKPEQDEVVVASGQHVARPLPSKVRDASRLAVVVGPLPAADLTCSMHLRIL
ncbi:hypothetical protein Bpro_0377 [Polaromonas sp. JS666]|nr:hypothetical protein Bpro_0377 [Polaromonas sp. JS666]